MDFDLLNIVTSEVVDDEKTDSHITCVATKGKEVVEDFLCNRKDDMKRLHSELYLQREKHRK